MIVGLIQRRIKMTNWNYFENIQQYHPIIDANNLYDGFIASRRGSHWKETVQKFRWNMLDEIRKLQIELSNLQNDKRNAYKLSPYLKFTVNERGKTRAITALSVRDRVVKHSLNDNFLLPHIRQHLIYDNGASLKGKGVSFTRNRLIAHLEKFYKETGSNDGYIMTMDFSSYYDNIDHNKVIELIDQYEDDEFAKLLVKQALDSYKIDVSYMSDDEYDNMQYTKFNTIDYRKNKMVKNLGQKYLRRSLSVGDQTSQVIAVAFPTRIDNLVKIINSIRYYGRYMDDLYVIAKTVDELKNIETQIEQVAKELKLFINPRKTVITKLSHTFKFMQFKYFLANNGHVVVRVNPKMLKRMRKKLKKLHVLLQNDKADYKDIELMFKSWISNHSKYMSNEQIKNIIVLYRKLFGKKLDGWFVERKLLNYNFSDSKTLTKECEINGTISVVANGWRSK